LINIFLASNSGIKKIIARSDIMLISEDEKKVVIGKINYALTYIVADDSIIDMIYDAYTRHIKLCRKEISFNDFCINYVNGDYNYSIRQGWQKI